MNKKDLKRLRKWDLLEVLQDLTKENELLRERNDELEVQLQECMLTISEAGSLAEAALQLNGVFRAAQDACDQYTYSMQLRCQQMEEETKAKCIQILSEYRYPSGRYEKENCE